MLRFLWDTLYIYMKNEHFFTNFPKTTKFGGEFFRHFFVKELLISEAPKKIIENRDFFRKNLVFFETFFCRFFDRNHSRRSP